MAEVRPLSVVVSEPFIEIDLQRFDAFVEGFAQLEAEELVEHRAVETLDKAVGPGCLHLGPPVFDAVEVEIELIRVASVPQNSRPLSVKIAFTGRSSFS